MKKNKKLKSKKYIMWSKLKKDSTKPRWPWETPIEIRVSLRGMGAITAEEFKIYFNGEFNSDD